jgi:hypothetical protein
MAFPPPLQTILAEADEWLLIVVIVDIKPTFKEAVGEGSRSRLPSRQYSV